MTDWVVDRGLDRLVAQIDAAAPNRSRASDGSVGDAAHQAGTSQHNPESPPPPDNPDNQVDARDITHDPEHGADMSEVSEAIRRSRDRRIRYVIFNRRYFSPRTGWEWREYTGSNPHDKHMHVSVNDEHHDEIQDWEIGIDMAWDDDVIPAPAWAADRDTNPTWRAKAALGYALELAGRLEKQSVPALMAMMAELRERLEDLAKAEPVPEPAPIPVPVPMPEPLDYDKLARAILRAAGGSSE